MQNAGAASAAARPDPATGGKASAAFGVDRRRLTINGATKPGIGFRPLAARVITLSPIARYGIAVGAAFSPVLLQSALLPLWGARYPLIGFFPAIMVSGWLGGFWPGMVTTVLSALGAQYFGLNPGHLRIRDQGDLVALGLFVVIGTLISALNETWRRGAVRLTEQAKLLEMSDDAVYELDSKLRITSWNAAAERMYGYTAVEAVGRRSFELLGSTVSSEQRAAFVTRVEEGEVLRTEAELHRKDGSSLWSDVTAIAKRNADGTMAGLVSISRDITARKRADERFRLAVEAAPAAMIMVDQRGAIVMVNVLTDQLLGYARSEIIGQSIELLVPVRFRNGHKDDRGHFFRNAHQRPMGAGRDLYALRKDGSEVPVEIGLSPFETAEGVFVLAAVTDITERKQVEAERAQLLAREQTARADIERASRLKDDFLAVLSHELRTPLNAVLGYAHLLSSDALPAERAKHALAAIQRNALAQARLVESLLDLSRIMAGKLELDVERLDVSVLVNTAVDVIGPEAEAKGITLDVVVPPAMPALAGDGGRLQQVMWNLLSNAVKFTPRDGRVSIHVTQQDASVAIRISDTGQGIKPEFLPYVFDRFRQADGQNNGHPSVGLGLGLALVREMVQAHGGTVVADSQGDGHGSTFTVMLPLSAMTVPESRRVAGTITSLARLDILIVDDDGDVRDLLAQLLESRGATVRTVSSTIEAVEAIVRHRPDILLSDLRMPEEDGYSLIRKVRGLERDHETTRLPAIAVTAYATANDREQVIAAGYDWHVAKPVDPDALARAIAKVVAEDA
jgi:PAS domain S-box-containing protein